MRIGTHGILVNQFGQVLLIQRNDTRTFAAPGGGLERGELPTDNIAREIREETGIIAMPVRLVSVNFWALKPAGFLAFNFRCLQRGGELQTSLESPRVGFYRTDPLPRPMLPLSRQQIVCSLKHAGGPVEWWVIPHPPWMRLARFFLFNVLYPWHDLKRKLQGYAPFQTPPFWEVMVWVVVQNEKGEVLWRQTEAGWQLPGGAVAKMTPPWQTAVHLCQQQTGLTIQLLDLRGVYITEGSCQMALVFTARLPQPQPPTAPARWLPPTVAPADHSEPQQRFVLNALSLNAPTFQLLPIS